MGERGLVKAETQVLGDWVNGELFTVIRNRGNGMCMYLCVCLCVCVEGELEDTLKWLWDIQLKKSRRQISRSETDPG